MTNAGATQRGDEAPLRPYVAELHARWLGDEPGQRYRCLPGTLVFADISGFTPLTERLARRGRVGAEALTEVLNEVFDALLGVAAGHGGDLLKFGGDALLLLFDGPGHEQRACAAAAGMQHALRPWRRFHTDAGAMSLRMSVGVASGDIHAYLVGELHRELIVGGPVVSRVVALESAAEAGEIVVDDAVATALQRSGPSGGVGPAKGGGTLLLRAPNTAEWTGARALGTDVTDGVPLALREHLCSRIDDGEHRQAVLTFVQFKGLDQLLSSEGPLAVADALDDLVRRLQHACREHGVCFLATDLDGDGGKVLLVAGAPAASPDDADRTLVTLLDVVASPSPLTVRAGVNAGPAFAVDVGSRTRRTYAVMGDATNLAARVMGKAGPGQVVATAAVLERTRTPFEHQPLPPFLVKGKSLPVTASVVGRIGRHQPVAPARLVGRTAERALLDELAARCRSGQGGVLTFVGEPGIGKSALADHFRSLVADLPRFDALAAPYAQASPYYAVRGPLRELLGLAPDADTDDLRRAVSNCAADLLPWLPLVGVVVGLPVADTSRTEKLAAEFRRSRAHETVVSLLTRLLPGPAAVVVEDAHWVDEASAALLAKIAAASAGQGWAMVLTRRPGAAPLADLGDGREVSLGPLGEDEVTALADSALGDLPAHVRAQLAQRCAGNPLFLLELLQAARQGADAESLPDSLESLIAARIDALRPADRLLVRRAAVFGHRVDPALLAELVEEPVAVVTDALARLDGVVVAEDGGYRFAHALVRDAAYAALPYRQRRHLHGRAGELIESRAGADTVGWAGLLSLHFEQAQVHPKTWRYARVAAERARAQWAPAEACTLYQRALSAARAMALADAELAAVYEDLADCAELAGRYVDAAEAYRQARTRAGGDPAHIAELCRKEGWVRERSGRYSAAVRWYRRGIRELAGPEAEAGRGAITRTQLTLAEGAARLRQGRYREAVPLLHAAVDGAQHQGDEATLAHAYYLLDWAYTDLGSEQAMHYRELSLPIYRRLGNLAREGVVVSNLGIDAYFEGRWDEAVELYERGRVASTQAGDVVQAATAANNIGEVYSDQGRLDEARDMFRDALTTWQHAPFPVGIWLATSNLGRVAARAGRFDEAERLFAQARDGFGVIGADGYVVETLAREVERRVLAGEPAAASTLAEDTSARVKRIGGLGHLGVMLQRLQGCADAQLGDRDMAQHRLTEAAASAERSGNLYEQALARHALGQILHGPDGDAHRSAAAALLQRLDVRSLPPIPRLTVAVR